MLITFKSSAGPNVLMFDEVALQLLDVMGKAPSLGQAHSAQGIVTVEQMPDVLARLRDAVDDSRLAASKRAKAGTGEAESKPGCDRRSSISLAQRAQPLIDLLERSQRAQQPVVWG